MRNPYRLSFGVGLRIDLQGLCRRVKDNSKLAAEAAQFFTAVARSVKWMQAEAS
jgi:hypothetical protein